MFIICLYYSLLQINVYRSVVYVCFVLPSVNFTGEQQKVFFSKQKPRPRILIWTVADLGVLYESRLRKGYVYTYRQHHHFVSGTYF